MVSALMLGSPFRRRPVARQYNYIRWDARGTGRWRGSRPLIPSWARHRCDARRPSPFFTTRGAGRVLSKLVGKPQVIAVDYSFGSCRVSRVLSLPSPGTRRVFGLSFRDVGRGRAPAARPRGNPRFLRRLSHLLATVALTRTRFLVLVFAIFRHKPFAWGAWSVGFPPTEFETIPKGAFLRRVACAKLPKSSAADALRLERLRPPYISGSRGPISSPAAGIPGRIAPSAEDGG